jgi:hypothetical protein
VSTSALPASRPDRRLLWLPGAAALWVALYATLPALARALTTAVFRLDAESRLGASVAFFLYDVPKVLLLLTGVVFGVGVLRSFMTADRARALLAGRRASLGCVMAAGLGVATPFCTCSAVPLFIGFVKSGVPLGVTFSFLIAAPMVNEVALGMLAALFGAKVALLYLVTGLVIAIVSGLVIGRLQLEHYVERWVREGPALAAAEGGVERMHWGDRVGAGWTAVKEIVGKVWPWVLAGIAVGALIHGFVPTGAMARLLGADRWWSVPAAVLLGVPMYSNAAGIIPVMQALLEKGVPLGSALAFMMAVIGLSLPETIILRRVLRPQLLAVFLGVVTLGIIVTGYLFNAVL